MIRCHDLPKIRRPFVFLIATIAIGGIALAAERPAATQPANEKRQIDPRSLWEGRFTQCSYNAVSSALIYFYGPTGTVDDRGKFEKAVFADPVAAAGFGGFYGWGPWTSYMVDSKKMVWNGKLVTDLKTERFSLRPAATPEVKDRLILIRYAAGERKALREKLLGKLAKGPIVMWTPYAAALDAHFLPPWHHVSRLEDNLDAVPYGPFTHSVTLFAVPESGGGISRDRVLVTDCSARDGAYVTDPDTIISTSAAMTGFVRTKDPNGSCILDRVQGVKDDEFNVLFIKDAATQPAAEK